MISLDWTKCKDAVKHWSRIQETAVVTVKMDGWRARYVCDEHGEARLFTRTTDISDETIFSGMELPFEYDAVPKMSIVEMEMHPVGDYCRATEVPTILKSGDWTSLRFYPIAIPLWDGQTLSRQTPQGNIRMLEDLWGEPIDTWDANQNIATWEQMALENAWEGFVFKNYAYEGWFKLKMERTVDCIVTGFKEGKGKNIGLVGSLCVSVWKDGQLVEIANVSGMDDETRLDIDEKKDLMRVVEVRYQNLEKNRLRQPRFVRWRTDKPVSDCTWEGQL